MKFTVKQLRRAIREEITQAKLSISSPHRPSPFITRTCEECGNTWSSTDASYKGHIVSERCPDCGSYKVTSASRQRPRGDMSPSATARAANNLLAAID